MNKLSEDLVVFDVKVLWHYVISCYVQPLCCSLERMPKHFIAKILQLSFWIYTETTLLKKKQHM